MPQSPIDWVTEISYRFASISDEKSADRESSLSREVLLNSFGEDDTAKLRAGNNLDQRCLFFTVRCLSRSNAASRISCETKNEVCLSLAIAGGNSRRPFSAASSKSATV